MVWRIFVACLCQKLAACCIGTGDPRATLRIFQLSTATHCTVNWVKLKRVVNLLVWFQIPNINNYKPKQYSTHLFIFSWDGPFQGFYVQSLSCVVSDDVLWQRTQNTCHMLIWKTSDYLQPPLSPFPVSHHDLVCSVWFCQQRTRRCSFCSHMMYKPPNCYFVDWEQPIGCTTEGVPYRGTTTVLYLLHAADTQYIVVEHFPVLFSYLYGAKNCLYAITIFLFWPDIHTYC